MQLKMKNLQKIFLFLSLYDSILCKHEFYFGWKAFKVYSKTTDDLKQLRKLSNILQLQWLQPPTLQRAGLVLVKHDQLGTITRILDSFSISKQVYSDNIQRTLLIADELLEKRRIETILNSNLEYCPPYENYASLQEINRYLQMLKKQHPMKVMMHSNVLTFEGRPITYLIIKNDIRIPGTSKPVIYIDGGIHGNEWTSVAFVLYVIHRLVEELDGLELLERADWLFVPVANPDGFYYSYEKVRFWRKNRSQDMTNYFTEHCPGVDIDSNFGPSWISSDEHESPCSNKYAGIAPFSETESNLIRKLIDAHKLRLSLYLSVRQNGGMILYDDASDARELANVIAQSVNLTDILAGSLTDVLGYQSTASSIDYASYTGVKNVLKLYLPLESDEDLFILDPSKMKDIFREIWTGIKNALIYLSSKEEIPSPTVDFVEKFFETGKPI